MLGYIDPVMYEVKTNGPSKDGILDATLIPNTSPIPGVTVKIQTTGFVGSESSHESNLRISLIMSEATFQIGNFRLLKTESEREGQKVIISGAGDQEIKALANTFHAISSYLSAIGL
jgi:hypothetical protein